MVDDVRFKVEIFVDIVVYGGEWVTGQITRVKEEKAGKKLKRDSWS